jgi:hypothetical protein
MMMTKRSLATLLVIISAALAATLCRARAHAQAKSSTQSGSSEQVESPATAARAAIARKIDEFGQAHGCDHGARLDNFAIELMNDEGADGYVIAYGPGGEGGGSGPWRLGLTKEYLTQTRGIDAARIKTSYGGPFREMNVTQVEFWLAPFGVEPPAPAKYKNDAGKFKGKFAEGEAWDGLFIGEETGPPVGDMTLAGFAEVLRLQPKTVGYVVAYNGREAAPGAWRRTASRDAVSLVKEYGVESSRVKVIFAGYSEETRIQLWATPEGAPPPVKERKRERRPEKAAQVGSFEEFVLRYEENVDYVVKGLADVLKADEQLTACVVIHAEQTTPRDEDPAYEIDTHTPPRVDLVQLAEKLKARLKKEYGVSESRLVIMVGPPAREWALGELQTWVVPPGAALPDPSVTDEIDAGEQGEGNPPRSL